MKFHKKEIFPDLEGNAGIVVIPVNVIFGESDIVFALKIYI